MSLYGPIQSPDRSLPPPPLIGTVGGTSPPSLTGCMLAVGWLCGALLSDMSGVYSDTASAEQTRSSGVHDCLDLEVGEVAAADLNVSAHGVCPAG